MINAPRERCAVKPVAQELRRQDIRRPLDVISRRRMSLHAHAEFAQFLDPAPDLLPRHANFFGDLRSADHNRRVLDQQGQQRVQPPVGRPRQISHPFRSHRNCSASTIAEAVKGDRAVSDVRSLALPASLSNPVRFSPEPSQRKFNPPAAPSWTQYPWPGARFPSASVRSPPACPRRGHIQFANRLAPSNGPPPLLHPDARLKSATPRDSPNAATARGLNALAAETPGPSWGNPPLLFSSGT